ncbi:MAG: hypothetical protein NVSMB5_07750 [Candidatus Velthaea sp.]
MRTREQHLQTFVGERRIVPCSLFRSGGRGEKFPREALVRRASAGAIGEAAACGGDEPRLWALRNSVVRPPLECRRERIGERVLRAGEIARTPRKIRN